MDYLPNLEIPEPEPEPTPEANEPEPDSDPEPEPIIKKAEKKKKVDTDTIFKKPVSEAAPLVLPIVSDSESSSDEELVEVEEPIDEEPIDEEPIELNEEEPTKGTSGKEEPKEEPKEEQTKGTSAPKEKKEQAEQQGEEEDVPVIHADWCKCKKCKLTKKITEAQEVSEGKPPSEQRKRTRKHTQAQLDALKRGREKSLATRRAKKEIKQAVKVNTKNEREEIVQKMVKKDELEDLMLRTIVGYDNQKKAQKKKRKAEKKIEAEEQGKKDQIANTLKRALNPNDPDYWTGCFNITY